MQDGMYIDNAVSKGYANRLDQSTVGTWTLGGGGS
jgi:hypothetical protein